MTSLNIFLKQAIFTNLRVAKHEPMSLRQFFRTLSPGGTLERLLFLSLNFSMAESDLTLSELKETAPSMSNADDEDEFCVVSSVSRRSNVSSSSSMAQARCH